MYIDEICLIKALLSLSSVHLFPVFSTLLSLVYIFKMQYGKLPQAPWEKLRKVQLHTWRGAGGSGSDSAFHRGSTAAEQFQVGKRWHLL